VGVPGIAGVLAWILSHGDIEVTAWWVGLPAAFVVLNLSANRVGEFVARHRPDVRSPLHLD
jgi:hypothetical protein